MRMKLFPYTLAAHLVTFLPSLKQSVSPFPDDSDLHFIKSSLIGRHRAPIKKDALIRGADVTPISSTLGMCSGIGVVSMSTVWENLPAVSARNPSHVVCNTLARVSTLWRCPFRAWEAVRQTVASSCFSYSEVTRGVAGQPTVVQERQSSKYGDL